MTSSPKTSLIEFLPNNMGISVSVKLDLQDETVWLNLNQIADLFQRDKSVISRHLKKIFEAQELDKSSVVAFFATTATDGKTYTVEYFNLDIVLAVGYRVNSKRGIEFRRWASQILKDHLVKGFSFNHDKLRQEGLKNLDRSLEILKQSLLDQGHLTDIGAAAVDIIRTHTRAWILLNAFDENRLFYPQHHQNQDLNLTHETIKEGILELKASLISQKEASPLFGQEKDQGFQQIWGGIHQTFEGLFLYPSVYERAAHLFYFAIKDHPFTDGNKRIASFLLIYYLSSYAVSLNLTNEGLVALTLLIAQSHPQDKDIMIKLILNLLEKEAPCSSDT